MPSTSRMKASTTVAHDGGAGVLREPLQLLAERLDYDFLGVVDAVDYQPKLPVFGLQNHNADRIGPLGRFQPQHLIEVSDGKKTAAAFAGWNGPVTAGATLVTATQNQYTVSGAIGLVRVVPTVSWLDPRNRTSLDFSASFGEITQLGHIPIRVRRRLWSLP